MAPASVDASGPRAEGAESDRGLCKQCLGRGERSTMRYLQINDDVAVFVCEGDKCTSLPTLAPGSQLVVQRRAADITNLRRRKRRAASLPSSNSAALPPAPVPHSVADRPADADRLVQPCHIQPMNTSPLPAPSVLQWPNERQLCWLDVSMVLLVQFSSLRRCHQALGGTSILKQLCDGFDEAQSMVVNKLDQSQSNQQSAVPTNDTLHSVGQFTSVLEDVLVSSSARDKAGTVNSHQCDAYDQLSDGLPQDILDAVVQDGNQYNSVLEFMNNCSISSTRHQHSINSLSGSSGRASAQPQTNSTTNLAAAVDFLRKTRQELFDAIKPKMGCEEGRDDSPVTALPMLLRLDGATEEHFATRYRREFYCFSCGFTNVTIHRNVVMSVTATKNDFSMQHPTMHHPCPQCHAPGQMSRLIYHSVPACPLVHFSHGLSGGDGTSWLQQDFKHKGVLYQLRCLIQYKRNPDHFVIWIRDPSRDVWLECDDLSSPMCHWTSQEPSIPPTEVHILGWERQGGDCEACVSLQQQIVEIEDMPLPHAVAKETSDCIAPVRKKSCPVMVGRSASPLTTADQRSPHTPPSIRTASIASSIRSRSLPSSGPRHIGSLLSIGTPPQSPEFSMPKKISPSASANDQSNPNLQETKAARSNAAREQSKHASQRLPSIGFSETIPASLKTLEIEVKERNVTPRAAKMSNGDFSGFYGGIPTQIMNWQTKKKDHAPPPPPPVPIQDSYRQGSNQGFSISRMLRSLNTNLSQKSAAKRRDAGAASREESKAGAAPPLPRKIKRVRLPRRKFESFSAFLHQGSGRFSGYMKQDSPAAAGPSAGEANSPQDQEPGDQEDQYQSSALLTPSSSVSSPSACSESSLQNENACVLNGMEQPDASQDLSNTMDALCRALDIKSDTAPQATVSQATAFLDDSNFLEGLLS